MSARKLNSTSAPRGTTLPPTLTANRRISDDVFGDSDWTSIRNAIDDAMAQ